MTNNPKDTLIGKVIRSYAMMRVLQRHVDGSELSVDDEIAREEQNLWAEYILREQSDGS